MNLPSMYTVQGICLEMFTVVGNIRRWKPMFHPRVWMLGMFNIDVFILFL